MMFSEWKLSFMLSAVGNALHMEMYEVNGDENDMIALWVPVNEQDNKLNNILPTSRTKYNAIICTILAFITLTKLMIVVVLNHNQDIWKCKHERIQ